MEVEQRCDYISGARRQTILHLQRMLHKHNNFIKTFKTALEQMPTDEYKLAITVDRIPRGEHERCLNVLQVDKVAVVISDEEFKQCCDILIQQRGCTLQRVSETPRSYDALRRYFTTEYFPVFGQ
ncbi:hypothetical protein AVEN_274915-1 [Araneus ventricosus]|uniref:Uncharacterized protein n=1 Tax=Araneus ventricosus TaxID=182803 RepID=A0A4Y2JY60_ARAVE|nr:hypothetical protein AVEN_274915-1 [Araneus ventricosus]